MSPVSERRIVRQEYEAEGFSYAPSRLASLLTLTRGLRRGLQSAAAPRLGMDRRYGAGRPVQSSQRTSCPLSLSLSCLAGAALSGVDQPGYAYA